MPTRLLILTIHNPKNCQNTNLIVITVVFPSFGNETTRKGLSSLLHPSPSLYTLQLNSPFLAFHISFSLLLPLPLPSPTSAGCGTSELGHEEQMPANSGPFNKRIDEIKQRRRACRSVSIVSTSELLRSDGCEGDEDDSVKKAVQEIVRVIVEKRKKEMRGETAEREDREEFPGSPSFRVYCADAAAATIEPENDPINVIEEIEDEKRERIQAMEEKRRGPTHGRENSSEYLIPQEDSVGRAQKKEKGRRFLSLTKASSRVYCFLSVKNCYSPSSATGTAPDDCPRPHHHSVKSM